MNWLLSFFQKKDPPPPKFADVYHTTERVVKLLEIIKFNLEECSDWVNLSPENRAISAENIAQYHKRAKFQCESLRDELLLTLQRMPHTKLVRKEHV